MSLQVKDQKVVEVFAKFKNRLKRFFKHFSLKVSFRVGVRVSVRLGFIEARNGQISDQDTI